jgi:hypothetical protein
MALYCGIVKLHDVDGDLTRRAVNTQHMTRTEFRRKFEIIYTKPLPDSTTKLLT